MNIYDFNVENAAGDEVSLKEFLIDREGNVVERFEPTADMADVEEKIISLL